MDDQARPQSLPRPGRILIPAAVLTMLEGLFLGLIPAFLVAGPDVGGTWWWQIAAWTARGLTVAVVVAIAIAAWYRVRWAWHALGVLAFLAVPLTCCCSLLTMLLYLAGTWPATTEGRWTHSRDLHTFG